MKHVKKLIKLANLNSEGLNEKEQNIAVGGAEVGDCICLCYYAMCGGSSTVDNDAANKKNDLISMTPGAGVWGYNPA